jgi:hypothetical protein
MVTLVRHLHAYIREVRLTEPEWLAAIEFLTRCGRITDDRRQEFILLSDVLGISMQTITINNQAYADATEATVLGPFFVDGSPAIGNGGDMALGAAGQPSWVEGSVRDTLGKPLPGRYTHTRRSGHRPDLVTRALRHRARTITACRCPIEHGRRMPQVLVSPSRPRPTYTAHSAFSCSGFRPTEANGGRAGGGVADGWIPAAPQPRRRPMDAKRARWKPRSTRP